MGDRGHAAVRGAVAVTDTWAEARQARHEAAGILVQIREESLPSGIYAVRGLDELPIEVGHGFGIGA